MFVNEFFFEFIRVKVLVVGSVVRCVGVGF